MKARAMWSVCVAPLLVLMMLLSGCGPDPRQAAAAEATKLQAQEAAADAQAARAQREAEAALKLKEAEAASAQWTESWNFFVRWWMFFVTFSVSLATNVSMIALAVGFAWFVIGAGRAGSIAATNRARQLPFDAESGGFPALQYEGKGIVSVTDVNTGKTMMLDTRNEGDRQMIAGAFAVRLSGIVSRNARKAKDSDSAGVAMVGTHPTVVGAKEDGLQVGEFVEAENAD